MNADHTVLVVDDSDIVRKVIRKQLEASGFRTLEASGAADALEILKRESVALITLDIDMPRVNGFDCCKRIREIEDADTKAGKPRVRTPIIFVTANDTVKARAKGFEVGACDYVIKSPTLANDLANSVTRFVRPRRVYNDVKVLVVDDCATVRMLLEKWIKALGAEVEQAGDGKEAFLKLQKNRESYDAIMLDYEMPNMNGLDLCRLSRKVLGMKVPVFILTAKAEQDVQLSFFQAGATDFLGKPFLEQELAARLKVHLESAQRSRQAKTLTNELHTSAQTLRDIALSTASDIKSPVAGIHEVFRELEAKFGDALGEEAKALLAKAAGHLNTIQDVSIGLMAHAADHEDLPLEKVELKAILDRVANDLQRQLHQRFAVLEYGELPEVMGVSAQLFVLFRCLITNGIRHQAEGSKPFIRVDAQRSKTAQGEGFLVHVKDNGLGFENSDFHAISALFERSGKKTLPGGVSLLTCRKIIEAHGGFISVDSAPGRGAIFSVFFPDRQ